MKKAPSENSIATAHISWQDVDYKLAMFRQEPKISNSEKLAADLLAELDLSMDDRIMPQLVTKPEPKPEDIKKKGASRRQAQRDHWVQAKSKSVASIPTPEPPTPSSRPASTKISKTEPNRQPLNRSTSASNLSKLVVQSSPQKRNQDLTYTSSDNSARNTPVKSGSIRERSTPLPLICSSEIADFSPQPDMDHELDILQNNLEESDPLEELLGPQKKDTAYESLKNRLHQLHSKAQELGLSVGAHQSEESPEKRKTKQPRDWMLSGSGNLSDSMNEELLFSNEVEQLLDLFEKEDEESESYTKILNNKEPEYLADDFIEIPPIENKRVSPSPIIQPPAENNNKTNQSPSRLPGSRVSQSPIIQPPVENNNKTNQSPSKLPEGKWVVLRKLGAQRGGVKVRLPSTLSELIKIGSEQLNIVGVKVREYQTEAAIIDIDAIESDILYLTTAEEEKMF